MLISWFWLNIFALSTNARPSSSLLHGNLSHRSYWWCVYAMWPLFRSNILLIFVGSTSVIIILWEDDDRCWSLTIFSISRLIIIFVFGFISFRLGMACFIISDLLYYLDRWLPAFPVAAGLKYIQYAYVLLRGLKGRTIISDINAEGQVQAQVHDWGLVWHISLFWSWNTWCMKDIKKRTWWIMCRRIFVK